MTMSALSQGSRVAIVSPSGPVHLEHIEHGIQTLISWGLVPVLLSPFDRFEGYLAGSDEHRRVQFQKALDGDFDAIIATRGGYGAMRILPDLDFSTFLQKPKLLCGFSDVTALLLHIAGNLGVPTLHCPVLKSFSLQHVDIPALHNTFFGSRTQDELCWNVRTVSGKGAIVEGRLFAGNLTLITSLLDSPFCPDFDGAILVVEDVGEVDYRIDRLLTSLRLSRRAQNLGALVLGDFTQCDGVYADSSQIQSLIERCAGLFPCPVAAGFPAGHAARNVPVPCGVIATLNLEDGYLQAGADVFG